MEVGNRLVAFTAPPKYPPKPENPNLIKSAFCCVQSCVPSAWARAIRHGGRGSGFLTIVRDALLPGHVLETAQCKRSQSVRPIHCPAGQHARRNTLAGPDPCSPTSGRRPEMSGRLNRLHCGWRGVCSIDVGHKVEKLVPSLRSALPVQFSRKPPGGRKKLSCLLLPP